MATPTITLDPIGAEGQPLVTIDGFAADPHALRDAAAARRFGAAAHYYPGIRAELPLAYWQDQLPVVTAALTPVFGPGPRLTLIDASFSVVTRAPAALTLRQRLPHCDAFAPERIALIHYLSLDDADGTAFFRHRATGFETITDERGPTYQAALDAELRDQRPSGYISGDTALFERTAHAPARFNRALLYRSFLLHSGAISPDATLSPDPLRGRLTITAFFEVKPGG